MRPAQFDRWTTRIAAELEEARTIYYGALLDVVRGTGDWGRPPLPALTGEGHFVVGSFQMWVMSNLLEAKGTQYLPRDAREHFVYSMYWRVLLPYMEDSTPEALLRGVLWFKTLEKSQDEEKHDEQDDEDDEDDEEDEEDDKVQRGPVFDGLDVFTGFAFRMREILFEGLCKYGIDGYIRSTLDLGLRFPGDSGWGLEAAMSFLAGNLMLLTQYVIASSFGDKELAALKMRDFRERNAK